MGARRSGGQTFDASGQSLYSTLTTEARSAISAIIFIRCTSLQTKVLESDLQTSTSFAGADTCMP